MAQGSINGTTVRDVRANGRTTRSKATQKCFMRMEGATEVIFTKIRNTGMVYTRGQVVSNTTETGPSENNTERGITSRSTVQES